MEQEITQKHIKNKIPVILDTDIGDDIDDTWALVFLLKCKELDLKMISTCHGNTYWRAKIVAKILQIANRTDIPIAIGLPNPKFENHEGDQKEWVQDYDLNVYPGKVYKDGIKAMEELIEQSTETVTLIAIGPLTNIAAVLENSKMCEKVKFVGMAGSIKKGYDGVVSPVREYNIKTDIIAAQVCFSAKWKFTMTITPLDTCGLVVLEGAKFKRIRDSNDPLVKAVMENYICWAGKGIDELEKSSILFDTVAVYLAFTEKYLVMEEYPLSVTDKGDTAIDPKGQGVNCAMNWKDLGAFNQFLVERLLLPYKGKQ